MTRDRVLNIILSVALIASLVYNFVLQRRSEAAIFRDASGEIVAVSGLVSDVSGLLKDNSFSLEEPDTGQIFEIKVGQSTQIRFLNQNNEFENANIVAVGLGDNVFVKFTEAGRNGVAQSIDILPGFVISEQ